MDHLLEILGSIGTYLRPGQTKAHLGEAAPGLASQRFALHKHPEKPQTHGHQACTGTLGV